LSYVSWPTLNLPDLKSKRRKPLSQGTCR